MALVLGLVALALLSLPLGLRHPGRRLPPARWARLVAACMVGGAALWEASLLLMGLPTVLRASHAGGLADACVHVLGHFQPAGSPVVGWVAAAAASWTAARAWRARRRTRRAQRAARVEPWLGTHSSRPGYELVILPCRGPVAMSVAGSPHQVIVSADLVESLSAEQFEVVLRHEAAHLAHRHHRHLALAAVVRDALGYFPMAGALVRLLATALERWADEDAAGEPGARAVLRDALWTVTATIVAEDVAAFAGPATVLERLAALDEPPAGRGLGPTLVLAAPALLLTGVAVAALAAGRTELRLLLAVAGLCAV